MNSRSMQSVNKNRSRARRGATAVLVVICLGLLMAMLSFAIDVGYICVTRTEMQNAADAGALAGAQGLYGASILNVDSYPPASNTNASAAKLQAQLAVSMNSAGRRGPDQNQDLYADLNQDNVADGDIVVGRLLEAGNLGEKLVPDLGSPNSVEVNVVMDESHPNGPISLFFAQMLGRATTSTRVTATASANVPLLLPITADQRQWDTLKSGGIGDDYGYVDDKVVRLADGVPEIAIFPGEWKGGRMPPGNFGLLNLGPATGSPTVRRQVQHGVSPSDLDYHGGSLDVGDKVGGLTGMRASIETSFVGGKADGTTFPGILGEVRYLILYNDAQKQGSNATFTISKIVAVRVMDASLKGNPKAVVVQPVLSPSEIGFGLTR